MAGPIYSPQQLRKDVRGTFIEALMADRGPSLVERIATVVNSDSDKENYAWLSEVAPLEEWVDELPEHDLQDSGDVNAAGYELTNKKYAGALRFKRDDLADEKTGGFRMRIRDLAQRAKRKADALLVQALIDGTTNTGYDGVAFFSASHTARAKQTAAQSNLLTGNGTTTANCATDINAAIAALYNFLDEGAEPLNEYFNQLWIGYPPVLNKPISEAVEAQIISQTSNVQFKDKMIELIPMPRLTSDSAVDYYVGIKDAEVRGLVWQDREGVSVESLGPQSDTWVIQEEALYKARMRGVAGYGRWQRCIKVNNT